MRFLSLANRNLKELVRDIPAVGISIGIPALILLIFVPLINNAEIPVEYFSVKMYTPAVAIFGLAFLTMISSVILAHDRETAFLSRLLTTPLRSSDFILAYVLPFIPFALLQITVCYCAGAVYGFPINIPAFLSIFIIIPTAIIFIGIGMIIGSFFNEKQAPPIGSMILIVVGLTGGVYMDPNLVGGIYKSISYALPFAHAVDATRAVIYGSGFGDIVVDLIWIIGYAILFFVLGVLCFKWKTKG
jgi:ABC-2 type transport system permease protein